WGPTPASMVSELKKRLSRAANAARYADPQGRRVHAMHAAKVLSALTDGTLVQRTLWDHGKTMSADHAETSFRQRLDQIEGAAVSLKQDCDSFNDNNPNAVGHQIDLFFNLEQAVSQASDVKQEVQIVPAPDMAELIAVSATGQPPPSSQPPNVVP